jgi:transposase-like protein
MTAPSSIDPARFLQDHLASASPDLLRSMLTTFINTLMSAEADARCAAPATAKSSPERVNIRNGYLYRARTRRQARTCRFTPQGSVMIMRWAHAYST